MIFLHFVLTVLGIYITNKLTYDCINGSIFFLESLYKTGDFATTRSVIHKVNFPDFTIFFASIHFLTFCLGSSLVLWIILNKKDVLLFLHRRLT